MKEAAAAILLQADEILVKPLSVETLVETIRERLTQGKAPARVVESVANILGMPAMEANWRPRGICSPMAPRSIGSVMVI